MNNRLEQIISKKYELIKPFLDELKRRLFVAAEAISLGEGGISTVYRATGISRDTISRGCKELESGTIEGIDTSVPNGNLRAPGGGRKKSIDKDPTLVSDLETLIESTTRGDPESSLRWTSKSSRKLAEELVKIGHKVTHARVADMLHMLGYSLQANRKTIEGTSHPDRDQQFNHINEKCKEFQAEKQPVISVDTKKKESVGNLKTWVKNYDQLRIL